MISVSGLDAGDSTGEDARPALALVGSSTAVTTPYPVGISKSLLFVALSACLTLSNVVVEAFGEGIFPSRVTLLSLNGYATTPLCGRELSALRYVFSEPGTLTAPLAFPASDIEGARASA